MFSKEFDLIFGAILLGLAVIFFLGKGQGVLEAFSGKYVQKKKRSPEKERKYQMSIGIYLGLLGICECVMAFYPGLIVSLTSIGVAVIGIAVIVFLEKRSGD